MAIGIYMDVHVPAAVSQGLALLGHNVLTAQLDQTTTLDDSELLSRASSLERVLFTQDDDLLRIAAERQSTGEHFVGVIYAHQLSTGIGPLVQDLDLILSVCEADELAMQVIHLPLS